MRILVHGGLPCHAVQSLTYDIRSNTLETWKLKVVRWVEYLGKFLLMLKEFKGPLYSTRYTDLRRAPGNGMLLAAAGSKPSGDELVFDGAVPHDLQ